MKRQEFGALVLLAAIWGMSFLLIRIAAPILGPLTLVTARMLIASVGLLLYTLMTRQKRPALRVSWKAYLVLGLLNSVLPLSLEAFAVMHLPASLVAILLTVVPLLTALAAGVWLHERLTGTKLMGLLLGLLGVGVLVGWSKLPLSLMVVLAVGAVLLAAVFYALASIYAQVTLRGTSALSLTIGQELLAGTIMLPLALASPPVAPPSLTVVSAVVMLGLVMTAGGNLLYFYLLDHVGPIKTQSVAFLIPVFALLASVVFLGERVTGATLLGLGIILASVKLVIEAQMRLPRVRLSAAMRTQLTQPPDAIFLDSARLPIVSRLSGAWFIDSVLVYDRQSKRRDSHERRPAVCI